MVICESEELMVFSTSKHSVQYEVLEVQISVSFW